MVDAATASQRRRLGAVAAYGLSGRPQFFLHFPGSGGTSIHAFALALYGRNSLPLANLSSLPRLLGVDVAMPHEVTGAHSTRRDVDPDLRALLEAHNVLDIRLYEGAQALFERRMASLPRDNR